MGFLFIPSHVYTVKIGIVENHATSSRICPSGLGGVKGPVKYSSHLIVKSSIILISMIILLSCCKYILRLIISTTSRLHNLGAVKLEILEEWRAGRKHLVVVI